MGFSFRDFFQFFWLLLNSSDGFFFRFSSFSHSVMRALLSECAIGDEAHFMFRQWWWRRRRRRWWFAALFRSTCSAFVFRLGDTTYWFFAVCRNSIQRDFCFLSSLGIIDLLFFRWYSIYSSITRAHHRNTHTFYQHLMQRTNEPINKWIKRVPNAVCLPHFHFNHVRTFQCAFFEISWTRAHSDSSLRYVDMCVFFPSIRLFWFLQTKVIEI